MQDYEVKILETLEKTVRVQASNMAQAKQIVEENHKNSEYVLGAEDYVGVSFHAVYPKTINYQEVIPQNKEYAHGYEITQEYNFKKNIGIALAENKSFSIPYTTWQYTKYEDGTRVYFWGDHFHCEFNAKTDFNTRITDYHKIFDGARFDNYRYYALRERIVYNNFPKPYGDPEKIVCFDKPASVENGKFKAWGYIEYHSPLSAKEIKDFGLRASLNNPISDIGAKPINKESVR